MRDSLTESQASRRCCGRVCRRRHSQAPRTRNAVACVQFSFFGPAGLLPKDAKLVVVIQDQAGRERIRVPGRLSISGRPNARPMTGSAKQPIKQQKERMDCFAPLAMTSRHDFKISRRDAPESCVKSCAPLEGVGNAGCPLHPRPRVHLVVVERTRVTTSTPESPGIPVRNGFTAYVVLSPVTGLFCHRHQRIGFV